jgi:hypothetical protein
MLSKIVIYNNEDHFLVYDEIAKDPIEMFLKTQEGKAKLLHYIKHLLDKSEEQKDTISK